jgi:nitrate/nitrite transporter NarK
LGKARDTQKLRVQIKILTHNMMDDLENVFLRRREWRYICVYCAVFLGFVAAKEKFITFINNNK